MDSMQSLATISVTTDDSLVIEGIGGHDRRLWGLRMKPSPAANDNLTERTCRLWKRRLGRDLSRKGARQIAENMVGFFAPSPSGRE
jgi:hypothetical protein